MEEKRTYTLIFVPHSRARFRKLHIPVRIARRFLMGLAIMTLALGGILVHYVILSARMQGLSASRSSADISEELTQSLLHTRQAVEQADLVANLLASRIHTREEELANSQRRYDALKALSEGQEDIARAHARILAEGAAANRWIEWPAAFLLGFASSLMATIAWRVLRTSETREVSELPRELEAAEDDHAETDLPS